MAVRLVGIITPRRLDIVNRHAELGLGIVDTVLLAGKSVVAIWVVDPLVGTSWDQLLSVFETAVALITAVVIGGTAANGEHPEEATANAECDCEPSEGQETGVERGVDVVCFCDRVQSTDDDGGFDSGHDRSD